MTKKFNLTEELKELRVKLLSTNNLKYSEIFDLSQDLIRKCKQEDIRTHGFDGSSERIGAMSAHAGWICTELLEVICETQKALKS